jgi:DNA polymerase III subunit gamma/tau
MAAELSSEFAADEPESRPAKQHEYMVVARRYRPQDFTTLVGQDHISQGLANAIATNRVGHAYLFTGARGVGKTSTARIFAKALNCVRGPTNQPCGECDVCQGIASGDDVDVLEIDGASNRGIDEIRQLRQNVSIRPSRARFKIYIIDEVHMLTTPAFNALLKTLEEPPEHVKFIFCTTEIDKIPITVLSRCQRFDFSPMEMSSIIGRLEFIVKNEGIQVEPEALQIVARRAAGSMRDSQSLLEQLMSFGGTNISVADVHAMLGTANSGRLSAMAQAIIARDAASAMQQLDRAIQEGVDVGQFAEQLLGYFRDVAAVLVGCGPDLLLQAAPADHTELKSLGEQFGMETSLAAIQILDQAIARMRQSTHVRILVEMAVVRLCNLAHLDQLATLVAQLKQAPAGSIQPRPNRTPDAATSYASQATRQTPPPRNEERPSSASGGTEPPQKKNEITEPTSVSEPSPSTAHSLSADEAQRFWQLALTELSEKGEMTADFAKLAQFTAISAPNTLVVTFPQQYNYQKSACERPDRKSRLEETVGRMAGRTVRLEFRLGERTAVAVAKSTPPVATVGQRTQKKREKERHPWVKQAMDMFDAEIEHVTEPVIAVIEERGETALTTPSDEG